MALQRRYSLREAAQQTGYSRDTLRRMLILAGIRLRDIARGSKHGLTEEQINAALRSRTPRQA